MKFAKLTAVGAVLVAARSFAGGEVPAGWMEIADSSTQITHEQGENGWSYWFTAGDGSKLQPMQPSVFVGATGGFEFIVWSTSPTMGCASGITVCHVHSSRNLSTGATRNDMHGNAEACCTPGSGRQDPILRWDAPVSMPARIEFFGQYAVVGGGDQPITLGVSGVPALIANEQDFGTGGATVTLDLAALSSLTLTHERCTPFTFKVRVLTPDCNSNGIPDAVEISGGSLADQDQDGIPDSCQCAGDVEQSGAVDGDDLAAVLTVWGTNGGVYPRADTNGDGVVDGADLATVLGSWGGCP